MEKRFKILKQNGRKNQKIFYVIFYIFFKIAFLKINKYIWLDIRILTQVKIKKKTFLENTVIL